MPVEKHPHILISNSKRTGSFQARRGRSREEQAPSQNQTVHGAALERAYDSVIAQLEQRYEIMGINPADVNKGVMVELKFRAGTNVDVTTLENSGSKIELLNVKMGADNKPESAIVYIPANKDHIVRNQIKSYSDPSKNKASGPSNYKKYDRTETFEPVSIEKLWLDKRALPQDPQQPATWEVWLRKESYDEFKAAAEAIDGVTVSAHKLNFPEREICSIHCSLGDLDKINLIAKAVSGFRYLPTLSGFYDSLPPSDQRDWSDDLFSRIVYDTSKNVSVCVLDTGIMSRHPLLTNYIAANGMDTCEPDWGTEDHHGHGTQMAGVALLGDLSAILDGTDPISLNHCIESVKVFPVEGNNSDEHIGYITSQAVSRAEVNNPDFKRIFCLSWSMEHEASDDNQPVMQGKPTPLSAKIDQIAFGVEDFNDWQINNDQKRLLVISAGNIRDSYAPGEYLNINDVSEVEDPGQSWNALTVGAYTDKTFTTDPNYNDWSVIAGAGDLSAKSRTSVLWGESYWPTKPDIVLEGGNYLSNPSQNYMEAHPDTTVLTVDKDRLFSCVQDTSPANAEASRLAAMVFAEYPDFWPETVRGLMVHSAEWVGAMKKPLQNKNQKIAHLRRYGYGVPQTDFLLNSFSNRPCIVIQDYISPYKTSESETSNGAVFGDLNHYVLPWPAEKLQEIYDKRVRLRVTLSFFIEPNPSERPPKTKYSYASHGLRFKLKRPGEQEDVFLARVGQEIQAEADEEALDEDTVQIEETDSWILGPHSRDRGSLISDIWEGTAAELASQNMIAIAPQGGWWKFRNKFPSGDNPRYLEQVRYSLILSLIIEEEVDLYTPISTQIAAETEILV